MDKNFDIDGVVIVDATWFEEYEEPLPLWKRCVNPIRCLLKMPRYEKTHVLVMNTKELRLLPPPQDEA